jgi:hypothetical protein
MLYTLQKIFISVITAQLRLLLEGSILFTWRLAPRQPEAYVMLDGPVYF